MFVKLNTVNLKIVEWTHDHPPTSAAQVTFWASYVLMFQLISNPLYYYYLSVLSVVLHRIVIILRFYNLLDIGQFSL